MLCCCASVHVMFQGREFYLTLLKQFQARYKFNVEAMFEQLKPFPYIMSRTLRLALHSAHMCLLCLGDLARNKEQLRHGSNYAEAKKWYEQAQMVSPRHGRPYNKLAIIAMHVKRLPDAVYYFMRSLNAVNPFLNGREILQSIFEDVRKRPAELRKGVDPPRQEAHR